MTATVLLEVYWGQNIKLSLVVWRKKKKLESKSVRNEKLRG